MYQVKRHIIWIPLVLVNEILVSCNSLNQRINPDYESVKPHDRVVNFKLTIDTSQNLTPSEFGEEFDGDGDSNTAFVVAKLTVSGDRYIFPVPA